jgi:FMN-dependent NADH-azoreductase
MVFDVDPRAGYSGLLAGRGRRAAAIYTSAVWGPPLGPEFGSDFQSTFFNDWLRWIGIEDITNIRFHPTLTGDVDAARRRAHAEARTVASSFGAEGPAAPRFERRDAAVSGAR